MKINKLEVIKELELLNSKIKLSLSEIEVLEKSIKYGEISHYLESLKYGTKPETASADLLKKLAEDILDIKGFSEKRVKGGFADFVIQENKVNPLLIELKPAFDKTYDKGKKITGIQSVKLEMPRFKEQVQKYLTSNDFVILTNLNDAFLFNRDALIEFKPFYEIKFTELLKHFLDNESLWDTVRRLEDQNVKLDLESEFFLDLNKWFEELQEIKFIESDGFTKDELIVLLINKIIFIKTLEDHGLIPFRFLVDEYFQKFEKWKIKGYKKILDNFFTEIEEWFWDYYDTELFRTKIWDYIEKSDKNLEKFHRKFEIVLGVGTWEYAFGKGMVHYNYRNIDEDVFGKAYETFIAKTRKDAGIYYTHRLITQYMSEELVNLLVKPIVDQILIDIDKHNYSGAQENLNKLYNIKVSDTTSGSGSFLIKCFREIFNQYQRLYKKLEFLDQSNFGMFDVPKYMIDGLEFREKNGFVPNDKRKLISLIILRHIFALDIDDRALETAKTNIWKEAIKLEKGLFNYAKLDEKYNHILPNLQLNFINADAVYDLPIETQLDIISNTFKKEIVSLHKIRNQYMSDPTDPDILEPISEIKLNVRETLLKEIQIIPGKKPTFVCLELFYNYFDAKGEILKTEQQGFDAIIGNPPWEEIYPVKKEFAEIGKYEMDKADFDKEFALKLKNDPKFKKDWDEYEEFYKVYTKFVSTNYKYHILKPPTSAAMRSHLNYFKLLFERDVQLVKKDGYVNVLIPSSFQTDEGSYGLRKLSFVENKLISLFSFENKGYYEEGKTKKIKLFPDVHPQFKFSIVFLQKTPAQETDSFNAMFYLKNPKELYSKTPLKYDLKQVKAFSPNNLSVMEFTDEQDYIICSKIATRHPTLSSRGFSLRREFNVTDDADSFSKTSTKDSFPVYEGKTIHQFNSTFSEFNMYTKAKEARKDLLAKETGRIKENLKLTIKTTETLEYFESKEFKLDFDTYRMVYRAVASTTNERTLISSIIPPNSFSVNSVNYLINCSYKKIDDKTFSQELLAAIDIVYVMALFNSITLNYYIRNKISANLNMFYLYELPIPEISDELRKKIIELAYKLLFIKTDGDLFNDLGAILKIDYKKIDKKKEILNIEKIRSELEILIAKELFKLSKADWKYITSTFIYGEDPETRKELDEIIRISNENY